MTTPVPTSSAVLPAPCRPKASDPLAAMTASVISAGAVSAPVSIASDSIAPTATFFLMKPYPPNEAASTSAIHGSRP